MVVLATLAPARRRLVLGLLAALVAGVLAGGVAFAVHATSGAGSVEQDRPGPVLLVPGYGGATDSLQPLATTLRATGRDVTVVALPDRATGDLTAQAGVLADVAKAARDRTGADSVDVVGYSAGGVVAQLWVREEGGAGEVRRLVTLGSPLHGTQLAAFGQLVAGSCPVACQQLVPQSPLLAQLLATALPDGPAYLSLWSTSDDVVLPPTSAILDRVPSPSLQSICPSAVVRHSALPSSPQVIAMVRDALAAGPIPTWTSGDCARLTS